MTGQVRCSCGQPIQVGPDHAGGMVTCPGCGLIHSPSDIRELQCHPAAGPVLPGRVRGSWAGRAAWPVVAVSAAAVLMVFGALLWAVSATDSTASRPGEGASGVAAPGQAGQGDWYSDNIGLLMSVRHYKLVLKNGRTIDVEEPVPVGTCFAVSGDGLLLTARHVSKALVEKPEVARATLAEGVLTFQDVVALACFGRTEDLHYRCTTVYESAKYDMAVLKISCRFASPVRIADRPARRGDSVELVGYPGVVTQLLTSAEGEKLKERAVRGGMRDNRIRYTDQIAGSAYEPTLTRGDVSAVRNVDGVVVIHANVTAAGGNSGGPLLNASREVIGLLTFGPEGMEVSGGQFSFAPALSQMMDEIRPHLRSD